MLWSDDFERFDARIWRKAPDGWTDRYGDIDQWAPDLVTVANSTLRLGLERRGAKWCGGLVHTRDTAAWTYGYFAIRARLPAGEGLWSALWMMPVGNDYGYWPNSGEIDIVEYLGKPAEIGAAYSSVHFAADAAGTHGHKYRVAKANEGTGDWSRDWHTWGCLWQQGDDGREVFRFDVDGLEYGAFATPEWPPAPGGRPGSPFDRPFHLILNIAVGGDWAGPATAAASGKCVEIDWIRVYQA
jgi:beta-glucanase (GH16 family)